MSPFEEIKNELGYNINTLPGNVNKKYFSLLDKQVYLIYALCVIHFLHKISTYAGGVMKKSFYFLVVVLLFQLYFQTTAATAEILPQPGWPVATGGQVTSPTIADLDGDGNLETVVGSGDNKIYALHNDGTPVAGWPITLGGYIYSSAVVVDLDGDGQVEVVVGCGDHKVYAWHSDGTPVSGWPVTTGGEILSSPAIADLDNDGHLDIIVGSADHKVYAWNRHGFLIDGWPVTTGYVVYASPAIADLDGDGSLEVVLGDYNFQTYHSRRYAWHNDGTLVDGWPVIMDQFAFIFSSAAIADLDGDGTKEIAVGVARDGRVFLWHHDGTPVEGWPQICGFHVYASPVFADLDEDGYLDIIVGSYGHQLHAWHYDGTAVPGWPVSMTGPIDSSPAIADLDGDGHLEVLTAVNNYVYAFHRDGSLVTDWPLTLPAYVSSSPAVADLDGDGDLEVIFGTGTTDKKIYAYSLSPSCNPFAIEWGKFRHDLRNTGVYNHAPVLAPIGNKTAFVGQLLRFTVNASDADHDSLNFTAANLPQNAQFVDHGNGTATFSWTPAQGQAGIFKDVYFEVSDGMRKDFENINITVRLNYPCGAKCQKYEHYGDGGL